MTETKQLKQRLDFRAIPAEWQFRSLGIDWDNEPLILFEQGRPPFPKDRADTEAFLRWANTPPSAYFLVHWSGGSMQSKRFENRERYAITGFVQPVADGWLLGESRGGNARIYDTDGIVVRTLDLGDAIENLQTTPEGHIWVGYFDEGVFGGGIGQEGIVCFDPSGRAIFKYAEFAKQNQLPSVVDCYMLNVADGNVWACYYTDFPLVQLKSFRVEQVWEDFGATRAVAVRDPHFIRFPAYGQPHLMMRTFEEATESIWELEKPNGESLARLEGSEEDIAQGYGRVPFSVAARGSRLYVYDEIGLYELV